jgi:hypothetical protein
MLEWYLCRSGQLRTAFAIPTGLVGDEQLLLSSSTVRVAHPRQRPATKVPPWELRIENERREPARGPFLILILNSPF